MSCLSCGFLHICCCTDIYRALSGHELEHAFIYRHDCVAQRTATVTGRSVDFVPFMMDHESYVECFESHLTLGDESKLLRVLAADDDQERLT